MSYFTGNTTLELLKWDVFADGPRVPSCLEHWGVCGATEQTPREVEEDKLRHTGASVTLHPLPFRRTPFRGLFSGSKTSSVPTKNLRTVFPNIPPLSQVCATTAPKESPPLTDHVTLRRTRLPCGHRTRGDSVGKNL